MNPESAEYPDMTVYVVPDEASGKLEPIAVSIGGYTLPVLRAAFVADPNGTSTGTRALVGEVAFLVGRGSGICEVGSPEDIPDLEPLQP